MGLFGQKKPPKAVRKAEAKLDAAERRRDDTAENAREMRQQMRGTSQIHQTIRSGNAANRSAAKGVKRAERDYNNAVKKAAEKAAKRGRG
jgi:predicted  nucleic acid-binding Zn-ribbon protein